MSAEEQSRSMSVQQIQSNIAEAREIDAGPIDLWGGEWWYWRLMKYRDPSVWKAVEEAIDPDRANEYHLTLSHFLEAANKIPYNTYHHG